MTAKIDREQLAEQLERLQEQIEAVEAWAEAVEDDAEDDRIAALRYEVTLDVDRFLAAAAMLVRSIDSRKAGRAAELAALAERLGKLDAADAKRKATIERLVAAFLEERGKGPTCRIKGRARLQFSQGSVEVADDCPVSLLPEDCRELVPAVERVNKAAARRLLREGKVVSDGNGETWTSDSLPGVQLVRARSLKWEC